MAAVALIAVAVLAIVVASLFAALLELYRDVRQLRDALGILDRPIAIDVRSVAGSRPSTHGLPLALDHATSALVLFLSDRCGTCRQLANGLAKPLANDLWVILEARNPDSAAAFLERYRLTNESRVVLDAAGAIARRIGLETTPVAFHVENGVLSTATTVPSSRHLSSILPEPIRLGQAAVTDHRRAS